MADSSYLKGMNLYPETANPNAIRKDLGFPHHKHSYKVEPKPKAKRVWFRCKYCGHQYIMPKKLWRRLLLRNEIYRHPLW